MLDRSRTRIERSFPGKLLSTLVASNLSEDGMAMIAVRENNDGVYRPSNGTADTIFAGFSLFEEKIFPTAEVRVELVTAVTTTLTLSRTPQASSLLLKDDSQVLSVGTPGSNANEYSISGNVVTLHSGQSGKAIFAQYRYDLTAQEALMKFGDAIPGRTSLIMNKAVTIVNGGEVFTNMYDSTVDWNAVDLESSAEVLKARANGLVSINGNGAVINGHVIQVPNVNTPFLGIRFNVD